MTSELRDRVALVIGQADLDYRGDDTAERLRSIADALLERFDIQLRSPHLLPDANEET